MRNLNERPDDVGSGEARLRPDISDKRLNAKLGPRFPEIRETNHGSPRIGGASRLRRFAGLPGRFDRD